VATFGGRLPIYVATTAGLDDHDDRLQILNLVQNSVVPLSESVLVTGWLALGRIVIRACVAPTPH